MSLQRTSDLSFGSNYDDESLEQSVAIPCGLVQGSPEKQIQQDEYIYREKDLF